MVTVETKIQQAIKEILEEETWKHLKSKNNFDKVLSNFFSNDFGKPCL